MGPDQWSDQYIRALRTALRLTVRDIAERLGVEPRTISRWEAGERIPTPQMQAALDTLLERSSDAEQARFAAATGRGEVRLGARDVDRLRDLFGDRDRKAPAVGVPQLQRAIALAAEVRDCPEADLPAFLTSHLDTCQAADGRHGSAQALPDAVGLIAAIDLAARQVGEPIRRDLLTLAARAAEFGGWLHRDAGAVEQATYWYDRAMEWAQEARNPAMQGYLLVRRSQLAYDQRDPIRVASLAEAAVDGPWQLPPCVQAEAAQQQALGLALLGRPTADVDATLRHAWELLEQQPSGTGAEDLGAVLTADTLVLRSAVCWTEAGEGRRAADLFEQVLSAGVLSRRDAGYFTARQAAAYARIGDSDTAAALAVRAVTVAKPVGSHRTMRVATDVATALQPWRERPAVRELHEAIR